MKTSIRSLALISFAISGLACPLWAAGNAPAEINSITLDFNGTSATYTDDLGRFRVKLGEADLTSGSFRYAKSGENEGRLSFRNWDKYSGVFILTFTSRSGGTFLKNYTGPYKGYISGTFSIPNMDAAAPPVAYDRTFKLARNTSRTITLPGVGRDLPRSRLKFLVIQKPRLGSVNIRKLPTVIYTPKRGFKGTETLRYSVREGSSESKPATIKFVVN